MNKRIRKFASNEFTRFKCGIEAVTAGEDGRGSNVVASEMRKLTKSVQEAAQEIQATVEGNAKHVDRVNDETKPRKKQLSRMVKQKRLAGYRNREQHCPLPLTIFFTLIYDESYRSMGEVNNRRLIPVVFCRISMIMIDVFALQFNLFSLRNAIYRLC